MTSTADWGTANSATTAPQSLEAIARRPDFLVDIERAKGLAIILVVIGHIVAREPPANNEWYVVLKTAIYAFHMPFFMYLGGLVFFHVGDAVNPRPSYGAYLIRRAERLLVPFLSLGLLILLGKFAAEQFLYVDNKPASLSDGLRSLFWTTGQSPATSVWYIFVVFVYCGVTPLLVRLSQEMTSELGPLHPSLRQMEKQVEDLRHTVNEETDRFAQSAKNDLARARDYETSLTRALESQKRQSMQLSQASVRLR